MNLHSLLQARANIAATRFLEDGQALCAMDAVEVVIDATG